MITFGLFSGVELVGLGIVALLIFGPNKLPELGKSLGKGIKEFKAASTGEESQEVKEEAKQNS